MSAARRPDPAFWSRRAVRIGGGEQRLAILHVDGHDICGVQVDPCPRFPVDAKVMYQQPGCPKETRIEFFVRVANGTRVLDALEREKYIDMDLLVVFDRLDHANRRKLQAQLSLIVVEQTGSRQPAKS